MQEHLNRLSWNFLIVPIYVVLAMWLVFWVEVRWNYPLNHFGILPGSFSGLRGVVFGPFLHGSLKHLFNNSVPVIVLLSALFYFYPQKAWRILLLGALLSGMGTWLIGRPAYHIGASGVVYMLASYLLFQGLFSKNLQLIGVSLIVVFFYGSLIWYLFPIDPKVSWEGHSSGFAVGILLAVLNYKNVPIAPKKYDWEQEEYDASKDVFMQHFDSNGNFHPTAHWYNLNSEEKHHTGSSNQEIQYYFEPDVVPKKNSSDAPSHRE